MRQMTTAYGMHALANFARKPEPSYEIPPHDIDVMLDTILAALPVDGTFDFKEVVTIKGVPVQITDALEIIRPHLDRIRIQSIGEFEDYFKGDQSPEGLTRDFNSGDQKARKVIRHMGIFPLEAMHVRTELAHPEFLMSNAQTDEPVVFPLVKGIFGDVAFVHLKGPHLPPFGTELVLDHFHREVPKIDRLARNVIMGVQAMPKSTPTN